MRSGKVIAAEALLRWVGEDGKVRNPVARTFEPDPCTHQMYGELYDRVYRKMYARLAPLYEAIAEITGYPAPRDAFE